MHFIVEYDVNEVIPFFMTIFKQLNPTIQAQTIVLIDGFAFENEDKKIHMFSIGTSTEESSWALVIGELALFQKVIYPFGYVCKSISFVINP